MFKKSTKKSIKSGKKQKKKNEINENHIIFSVSNLERILLIFRFCHT